MNKVIFLDYDGVVNTPIWHKNDATGKWACCFGIDKINNVQAVQWLSEIYEKLEFNGIVVTSTWRKWDSYRDVLIAAGLREGIEIKGCTPQIVNSDSRSTRGEEIEMYISNHPEIDDYIIIDDQNIAISDEQKARLVKTDPAIGITKRSYDEAEDIVKYVINVRYSSIYTDMMPSKKITDKINDADSQDSLADVYVETSDLPYLSHDPDYFNDEAFYVTPCIYLKRMPAGDLEVSGTFKVMQDSHGKIANYYGVKVKSLDPVKKYFISSSDMIKRDDIIKKGKIKS